MFEYEAIFGLQQQAAQLRFRLPLVLSGTQQWCYTQARSLLKQQQRSLWLGEMDDVDCDIAAINTATQHLGQEWDVVVFDAWCGLDPDALAAIAGTITAGGMLLLLCPPLDEWPDYNDPQYERIAVHPYEPSALHGHYLRYFAQQLRQTQDVCLWQEDSGLEPFVLHGEIQGEIQGCTPDQQRAITAVVDSTVHHPTLLVADRGRGKSAALGMAATQLLQQGIQRIIVTAPRPAAAEMLLRHAQANRPETKAIDYIAADELIRKPQACDLLLVDEAAALPTPMLRGLLQHYPRIAFATTVHGYEGTGRAFGLRFEKELQAYDKGYQRIELQHPIRYADEDPLERFIFQAMMLDVELPPHPKPITQWHFKQHTMEELLEQPGLLRDVYALLNMAHYRTRPYDLRQLLDGPNIRLFTLQDGDTLLGVLMLAFEGIDDHDLHQAIIDGTRRPRGHLIPQSLASHAGWHEALNYRYARIIRIAIHPDLQGLGLGSAMLQALPEYCDGVDFLATSFGATIELLHFWRRNGFAPVRLGFQRETNSGLHALMMLRPLRDELISLCQHWQARLQQQLPLLTNSLTDLEDAIVHGILTPSLAEPSADIDDQQDVDDFITGRRQYEACILGLQRLCKQHPPRDELIDDKLEQGLAWSTLAAKHQLAGRRGAEAALRKAVAAWRNTLQ